ncbi:PIG-L family deacetylase [soil metagenome]
MQEWSPSSLDGQKVLVVFAHPDDSDFYVGGTIARLTTAGAEVFYLCASRGDKGDASGKLSNEQISEIRAAEQIAAAALLGVSENNVEFLGMPDGNIVYNRELIDKIVKAVRKIQPNIVVALDTNILDPAWGVNHADHRAIGLATIDAVYPYARNKNEMPELKAHEVQTLLIVNYREPNCFVEISGAPFEAKKAALSTHKSQWGDAAHVIEKAQNMGMQETFIRINWW